jgi:hypothetical protein
MNLVILFIVIISLGLFLSFKNERKLYLIINRIIKIENEYKFYTREFKFVKILITFILYFLSVFVFLFFNKIEFPGQIFAIGIILISFIYISRNIVSAKKQFTNFGAMGSNDVRQIVSTVSKDKIIHDLYLFVPFFVSLVTLHKVNSEEKIIYFVNYLDKNKGYYLKPKESEKYKYQMKILLYHFIDERFDIDVEIRLRFKESHKIKIRIIDLMFRIMIFDDKYPEETEIFIKKIASKLRVSNLIYEKIKHKYVEEKIEFENFFNFANTFGDVNITSNNKFAYEILSLTENATNEEIKKKYRQLVQKHHPDKYEYIGNSAMLKAQELFIKIQQAYEIIEKERNM